MKKLLALLLPFAMLFSLTACMVNEVEEIPEEPSTEETVTEIVEEVIPESTNINAGVFWYNFSDAFLSNVRDALNTELDALGIEYTNYDAASVQATQNDQINTAIANGANLLIVNIVDTAAEDSAQYIVDTARIANVPVIFFNREVSDNVVNSYENACFVGTRAAEAGEMQGTMAGKYIVENYDEIDLNGDGAISYILMRGYLANEENDLRVTLPIDFCNAELTAAGKPELIYYDPNNTDKFQPSNWSKTTAFDIMTTALSTNPMDGESPIEVVFCNNDDMAIGCIEALNNFGWNTGESNIIPIFGIDYIADAADAIEAGKMTGSILQSYEGMAETIADLVENIMNGEHVFEGARDVFYVDETSDKIRVPYEIKMKEGN